MPLPYDDTLQLAAEGALLQGVEQVVEISKIFQVLAFFLLNSIYSFRKLNLFFNWGKNSRRIIANSFIHIRQRC